MSTTTVAPGTRMVFDDAALARVLDKVENAAIRGTFAELDVYLSVIADAARSQWYRQVDRDTGKSGDISGGVVAVSDTKIRGTIGTSDIRRGGKGGKPAIFYIHRPGPLSWKRRDVRESERDAYRAAGKPVPRYIYYPNPKRGDGAFLVAELINKPANAGKRELKAAVRRAIIEQYRRS
jgi:hypothetical protein